MSSINLQESQSTGCETYIAIVVDESGSINGNEAQQIREGLTSFINSQAQSKITLSLIGMSNSDSNSRSEHVIQKRISGYTSSFLSWINGFGSRSTDPQSDHWASGLEVVNSLTVTPDIIVVVTDGLQVNDIDSLKSLYQNLNDKSHIFVYGVTSTVNNASELVTPITTFLGKAPVVKNGSLSMLDTDYIRVPDFSTLGSELNQLGSALSIAQIGCLSNVIISQNKLAYPVLKKGLAVNESAGTLVLRNKSRVALTLPAGTRIHNTSNLGGLVFKLQDTIVVPALSNIDAAVRVQGTPNALGSYSTKITLPNVSNLSGFQINFNVGKELYIVDLNSGKTALQSTSLQISAAGSKGIDSTKGIHLRWLLAGELGTNHLPKGQLYKGANSGSNFNKPEDFVKVYRAAYTKVAHKLDLTKKPKSVDIQKALWIYKTTDPQRSIYVYFKNKAKYLLARASIDPMLNPSGFIQAYGNEIIEIENKSELFFAAELKFSYANNSGTVKLETLSVAENTFVASKRVTNRKTYSSTEVNSIRVVAENGRSIRFKASNCLVSEINFEFYGDFIQHANDNGVWDFKGSYALTLDDNKAFEQLEPKLNCVHGKWLKFNDDEYVNVNNYKDKWKRVTDEEDKNIKEVIQSYIGLSADGTNPTALETIQFNDNIPVNDPQPGEEAEFAKNSTQISNLDLLNIAANDYHVARMLGLGCIDIDETVLSGEYIYLAEYITFKNLEGDSTKKEVQHLSMSIPTSVNTERLPLPVQLSNFLPGLNAGSDEDNQTPKITDPEGYSFDGKKRYVSLFMSDIKDYSVDTAFFNSTEEYDGSSFTFPIYAGVDYKFKDEANWQKPELSSDTAYFNVKKDLTTGSFEPAPIIIPDSGKSFLNVRQEKTGLQTYVYQGYGINIFSRATSGRQLEITSHIKPKNTLLPPTGINSLLITEENPLMFTSMSEQLKLKAILDNKSIKDKTYIRLLFEYYAIQELLSYTIPDGVTNAEALLSDKIYPDNEELFADYFKLYFRDSLPQIEHAKITDIQDSPTSELTSIITIQEYKIFSSGEEIKIGLTKTNKDRFIGGILTVGEQNYVIQNINVVRTGETFNYATVEVLKKEVTDRLVSDGDATIDSEQIKEIKKPVNELCSLVENMLTPENWNQPSPISMQIQLPEALKTVHRELVLQKDSQGNDSLQVEKTRGIWSKRVVIEKVLEKAFKVDENGKYVLDKNENPIPLPNNEQKHFGLYKLTFKGLKLAQHPQYNQNNGNSVEWANGTVRLFTKSCFVGSNPIPVKSRKEFKVVRADNIGTNQDLELIITDPNFKIKEDITQEMDPAYDHIIIKENELHQPQEQEINYYPSYKVYLFADPSNGITAAKIQPREGENTHYSIFGISSHSNLYDYDSKISVPNPMYAVRIEKPVKPEDVKGPLYATRPDFFNRSTYTITTRYTRKPYGMLYYRASDDALLNVLYKTETVKTIREELSKLGGNNEKYFTNRWQNFLNFEELLDKNNLLNPTDLLGPDKQPNVLPPRKSISYEVYPSDVEPLATYRFPTPDSQWLIDSINEFIKWHNESQPAQTPVEKITALTHLNDIIISTKQGIERNLLAIHFIEQAIHSVFVPLTEVPIIYEYIRDNDYVPINKKQTIKDKNGNILKYPNPDLDIAPMMKITNAAEFRTQFTDFNLDGNSQSTYFYGVREMDIKLNFSPFSTFLGPVKLVPSNPPQTPEIKRIMPVLENQVLGIKPSIQIELNAYKPEYNIRKINIYRAKNMLDAQSIRTMTPVKEILINEDTLSTEFNSVWTVYDEFEDLESVPFGDGLFYRVTVSREIEYADPSSTELNPIVNIDYTPSQPSKITATVIADAVAPESPVLTASGDVTGANESVLKPIVFSWEKTIHNGKYHLYKMNNQGNWDKIQEKVSNEEIVTLSLLETKLGTDELTIKNDDGDRIYHHFKVLAENSSGMYSSEEKILTL
ncbi:VWA domain-containing protein [Flavobacterium chilense]|uniref:von Willebrand factor type A domain-containing protein n=1 Tax=Flavobacterium chilense TaxID=946677 RepID=A0A1M7ESS9_9FLAO|nr:VWA domain-containing protein [Flavobacterium chilense]SHL94539.1 von Willebrand factor type A domain-containing protein [Flavobacterium chilense]